jgi:restriction system protein
VYSCFGIFIVFLSKVTSILRHPWKTIFRGNLTGGAAGGFVVTSGVFTQEAKDFAEGRNIDLIDGTELTAIIKKIQPQLQAVTAAARLAPQSALTATADPSCPKCGNAMVKRTAKQGANTGKAFWGCTAYPQCRGIIQIN